MRAAAKRRRTELDFGRSTLIIDDMHGDVLDIARPRRIVLDVDSDLPDPFGRGRDGDGFGCCLSHVLHSGR